MSTTQNPKKGMLLLILCTFMWSISGVMIKTIPWNAMVIAGARSLISAGVMAVYIRVKGLSFTVNKTSLLAAATMSCMFFSFISANKLTTAANAIVIQSSAPVFVLLYGVFARKQRARPMDVAAVLLTLLGISLFFLERMGGGGLLGNLIAVLAGIFLAGVYVVTHGASADERMSGILLAHLLTAAVGIPFALFTENTAAFGAFSGIAFLGVVQLGIPYVLFGIAVQHCSPLACSLICMLEAVFNPIWVFLFTGEAPSALSLLGGALVLLTIAGWAVLTQRAVEKGAKPCDS